MPDVSMRVYLGRIICDHPDHVRNGRLDDPDFIADYHTRAEFLRDARSNDGWVFRANGETICPECKRKPRRT